ncbi:MAG: molybdate ABC transporter substrate-binding protein, partial [Actinomycetota bacterium]
PAARSRAARRGMTAADDLAGVPGEAAALRVFLPGSLAGVARDVPVSFAQAAPGAAVTFPAFAPTGLLAAEILEGAPADVFVSANRRYMQDLVDAGLVRGAVPLAGNRLAIVVGEAVQAYGLVAGVADLARPGLRVVTPQSATDPCGQYVVEAFARAGLAGAMAAKEEAGELLHSHGSADVPGYLARGEAGAGVLYRSEALLLEELGLVDMPPPVDMADAIAFWIGVVDRGRGPAPLARRFVEHMTGPAGRGLLAANGFLLP